MYVVQPSNWVVKAWLAVRLAILFMNLQIWTWLPWYTALHCAHTIQLLLAMHFKRFKFTSDTFQQMDKWWEDGRTLLRVRIYWVVTCTSPPTSDSSRISGSLGISFPLDLGKSLGRRGYTTQYILPLGSVCNVFSTSRAFKKFHSQTIIGQTMHF